MKSKVLQRKMFRDPSEDENVGIMQGFMDSLEEMLTGEGDMSEEEDDSPSGAPDRTPRSPEILMNTMRGDMRSVDARVEELADMVGYNAASSTPLEVLALLQPVLKQQGIAALPTSSAMPPSPAMAPPPSTSVPPVPTQGGGIATLPQGPPPMDMPMQMADGGVVQNFAEGDEVNAENVTPASTGTFSPEMRDYLNQRLLKLQESADTVPSELAPGYLMQRTQELAPQYRTLIGADPSASKGQMLFDVAQAALNYAGNVNAQGQQMRGSQAARLAGAFSGLPAAIGARAADAQKQNQNIRLAAMQGAQSEIEAARAAGTSRQDTLDKIAIAAMGTAGAARRDRASPISRAYDNGTVLTVVETPDGPVTKVFDPDGVEVLGSDRTATLRTAREEQVDFFQNKAAATAEGAALVERNQNAIDVGFDAAMALPTLKRAVALLDSVKTGGYEAMALRVKQIFGIESADEGELSGLLGKGVLSQLRSTFGAAFTEKEGSRLEGIEAGIGKNAQANRRLLGNLMQIMESSINRAISVADDETKGQLQSLRSLTLEDTETTPINLQTPAEGATAIDRASGSRIQLVNGVWEKI